MNPTEVPRGISLSNTVHSDATPCLPLPSLPVLCGALEQDLKLSDDGGRSNFGRTDVAEKIAGLLRDADVSYLNLKSEDSPPAGGSMGNLNIYNEVLRYNPEAFEYLATGPAEEAVCSGNLTESKPIEPAVITHSEVPDYSAASKTYQHEQHVSKEIINSSRKPKAKKKRKDDTMGDTHSDPQERQDAAISGFCEILEDLCSRAEIVSEDRDEAEWVPLSHAELKAFVNEIMSVRSKKILHMVPVDILVRTLRVLDHQIHRAEGLSIDDTDNVDIDVISSIYCSLESIHAALAIMAHDGMPKQIYTEENIERVLEFSRHQIMDVMLACDPAYRALHKPNYDGTQFDGEDDEEAEDFGSASKRRTSKSVKVRKSTSKKMTSAVNVILQKLCTILTFLKQLLLIERLSDSCILQLVRTSLQTILVDNIQLLQLKAISLIGGIYYRYTQHRSYIMDEILQILLKLPFSKRVPRTYHLPDEEQKQIQLVSALLIQMIHHSANLPEILMQNFGTPSLEVPIDSDYLSKCHEAVTESCCLFWSRVLQRYTSKNQEASDVKAIMENLVIDLLNTLNLPEYPASAPILEVLCVLLLQNAGLKSKDISARTMAIDLLGTIAARLKNDSALCRKEKFWIVRELMNIGNVDDSNPRNFCSICMDERNEKPIFVCQSCERTFHIDCLAEGDHNVPYHESDCLICLYEKQLIELKAYCSSQNKGEPKNKKKGKPPSADDAVTKQEIVQQMLLKYMQDAGSADEQHLFIRWFYLCLWYKDDPTSQQKFLYLIARFNSRAILRDSFSSLSSLTRDFVRRITLALSLNSSFARGFDKILQVLLASLRENSPVIRSKAMRAVTIIVEADPEVLGDQLVQMAVEGRFCDSAISVREAALDLVGRYIASHPEVGLKYFDKVAERIKDTGVSVRKRAIKIIKEMCSSGADFPRYTAACVEIISRINDEESSIQDLVCKTFYEFWFEEPAGVQSHHYRDGSCVPMEVAKKTEQIVEMLRKMSSQQPLVTVIKRNLALDFFSQSVKAAGINPVLIASVRRRCELMCKCLLEKVLQVSESSGGDGEGHMLPYVLLLHAFCLVDPKLCAPASDPSQFVATLQPYLKSQSDNRVTAQLLESILFIIDSVLPLLRKLPQNIVEELEQDLKQMIVRHSFLTVVHASIKCLCSAGKITGKGSSSVGYLTQLFYKRLDALGFDNKQQVGRSLFCLGLLMRYGSTVSDGRNLDAASSVNLFKKYLQAEDFIIKVRALQALGYVFIARPECMLQKDVGNILEATLSADSDIRLKMQSLQNMYEYLLDAESHMEPDKAIDNEVVHAEDTVQSVPVAAGAGDTNICGGIVQLYWDYILERCLDVNEHVRLAALKIVEIVLRQGLVHPITCVPYLIALETDPQEANSKLSHHLLMNMNEKYPAFCESRLGDGLQLSFKFIHSMNNGSPDKANLEGQARVSNSMRGKPDTNSSAYARLGVARIYKLIRGNRISRNRFMSSVVHKFDMPGWSDFVIPFLKYCTEILALLPFVSPDEPLYLIFTINRVVQVRAGTIESSIKDFLHLLQGNTPLEENGVVDLDQRINPFGGTSMEVERARTLSTDPNGRHLAGDGATGDSCSVRSHDLRKITGVYLAAGALQLLLKLKRHLKIVYGLDDARCQAFSPNDPVKAGESLSRQNIPFNISDVNIDPPNGYEDFLRRYQDFKNALREDTVDYSTYTANIKRKRPTPRKGGRGGGGRMIEVDDEDDENDDDWGSASVKRTNKSARKPNTRTRQQRMQV